LIAKGVIEEAGVVGEGSNMGSNIEIAKLPAFNGEIEKVGGLLQYVDYT